MNINPRVFAQHRQCETQILQRGPHWGLYCCPHQAWLTWLPHSDVVALGHLPPDHWESQQRTGSAALAQVQASQTPPEPDSW
jgi:hypothetical protein